MADGNGKDKDRGGEDKTLAGITALGDTMKTLGASIGTLTQRMDAVESGRVSAADDAVKADAAKSKERKSVSTEELDDMSRGDFVKHIVEEVAHVLVKPLTEQMDATATSLDVKDSESAVSKAIAAHSDFMEFASEINAIAKDTPGISPENAYKLARANDPEKVKKMDIKYMSDEDKEKLASEEEADEKKESDEVSFGGITPTSGGPADKKVDYKDNKAAFDAAWDENVTQPGLENMFRSQ